MKRFLRHIFISIFAVTLSFTIYKITDKYDLQVKYTDVNWSIKTKGIDEARSFDITEDDEVYIAYKDEISVIKGDNKEYIIEVEGFDIYDLIAKEDELLIATDNRVVSYRLEDNTYEVLIDNLPNKGLNKATKLLLDGSKLYITVGSNTNSGVVENKDDPVDKPSFHWTLSGETYGDAKTGGFSKYGTSILKGEKIKEENISNGIILEYLLEEKKVSVFATGIGAIEGIDINEEGKIIAIFKGMNNSGVRPIYNDSDYIYEVKKDGWYGWPDYSGGDAVSSPRFAKPGVELKEIIENPPTKSLYGPIYQHNSVESIKGLAIAKEDGVLKNNMIIFADNNKKQINILTENNICNKLAELSHDSSIEKILYREDRIYMLDSGTNCIYELRGNDENRIFYMDDLIKIFTIIFLLVIVICIVYKINNKAK